MRMNVNACANIGSVLLRSDGEALAVRKSDKLPEPDGEVVVRGNVEQQSRAIPQLRAARGLSPKAKLQRPSVQVVICG